ncbi:glycosyltransferase [Sedimentibacter saalensis]|uniref:glycosyltransferase n=1 Tax=Sedimentibacter saalensis TaxID=130788 RepID=UPI00289F9A75|nr:glycosyltransferase [Sedimentibacter saalensis]
MQKVIFTKYSNERDDKFKIKTSIIKNENDLLIVEKSPLLSEGKPHINNMYKSFKDLTNIYPGDMVKINKCEFKDNSVQFEFLEGETLEKKLDDLLSIKNFKGLYELISYYYKVIYSISDLKIFEKTESFTKIFGNVNLPYGIMSSSISNIDIIFSNIIINSNWNIIDYEWTFSFPVPLNYTIYRAINYYINSSPKRSNLINMDLLKFLGITNEEIIEYEIMERNFLNYTLGKSLTIGDIYNKIHGKCINVNHLIESASKQMDNFTQVFYDYGDGFNEANSIKFHQLPDINGKISFTFNVSEKISGIRVDPSNDYCIISIEKLKGYKKGYYDLEFTTNGNNINNKTIVFNTRDSQIYVNHIEKDTSFIDVEIVIKEVPYLLALYLNDSIFVQQQVLENKYLNQIKDSEEKIRDLYQLIDENNKDLAKLHELESTIYILNKEAITNSAQINKLDNTVKEYKDEINKLNNVIKEYKDQINYLDNLLNENKQDVFEHVNSIREYKEHTLNLENVIKEYENILINKDNIINEFKNSFCWTITKPIRVVGDFSRKIFSRSKRHMLLKGIYQIIPINENVKSDIKEGIKPYLNSNENNKETLILTDVNLYDTEKYYDVNVSIVIPTYNAEIFIDELINTLKAQKGVKNIEIVVVDSESSDKTIDICEYHNVNLIRITQSDFSHSFARNLGASKACGNYIIFMTQDALPTNDYWVYNMLTPIIKHNVVAVSCWELPRENCELAYRIDSENFANYLGIVNSDRIGSLPKDENYESLRKNGQLNDVSCAIVKSVFDKFKYYGDFAEDLELGVRLIKAGYKIALLSSERVIHSHNRSCGYYLKRASVDGRTLIRMFSDFPTSQQTGNSILSASIFAYYKIICLLDYLEEKVMVIQKTEDFFHLINNYLMSISTETTISVDQIQYGKIYSDEIADDFIKKIVLLYNEKFVQETYILNHMVHYISNTIFPYVEKYYSNIDKKSKKQIIDTIYKRFVVTSANELSLYVALNPQDVELKNLVDDLQRGV